jgi:hypothetical protein
MFFHFVSNECLNRDKQKNVHDDFVPQDFFPLYNPIVKINKQYTAEMYMQMYGAEGFTLFEELHLSKFRDV